MSAVSDEHLRSIAPANSIFAITPNDGADLAPPARGIVFKTAGALHILDGNGSEVTIPSGVLGVGVIHDIKVRKVFATGTTAVDIWGVA